MLEIKNLDIFLYPKYLVKNFTLYINKGDKVAIIGEEGNGKSTLLKCLIETPSHLEVKGEINSKGNRLGYLPQQLEEKYLNFRVFDYLFKDETNYFNNINEFYKYLNEVNLKDEVLYQEFKTLSGGEKVKVMILKLLLEEVDIYLLDEPTNDLDLSTLIWLENFINSTNKPVIFISHDETLLSNTANIIVHLEQVKNKSECRHTIFKGDYESYVNLRLSHIAHQTQIANFERKEFQKRKERLNRIMQKVENQQNDAVRDPSLGRLLKKKMHSLKSQERKLEKTELSEVPAVEEAIKFSFKEVNIPNSRVILDLEIPSLEVDNKKLTDSISLYIKGNEHIVIIGENGVGKTTLIKVIYNILKDKPFKIGYMSQNYDEILNNYEYPVEFITSSKKKEDITKVRQYLGNMNFTSEEMSGKIKDLSNGSKAKLILTKLVLSESEILILDEPTRNVSPLSNPIIRKVLASFNGPIISISHDRKYIEEVADKVYVLTKNGLNEIK